VSTFSWWAAFLSHATEIHFPLAGIYHPRSSEWSFKPEPFGKLTVYDEKRYIYHDLVARQYWGRFDVCRGNITFAFTATPDPLEDTYRDSSYYTNDRLE
jgi:hypothetical protein